MNKYAQKVSLHFFALLFVCLFLITNKALSYKQDEFEGECYTSLALLC